MMWASRYILMSWRAKGKPPDGEYEQEWAPQASVDLNGRNSIQVRVELDQEIEQKAAKVAKEERRTEHSTSVMNSVRLTDVSNEGTGSRDVSLPG